VDDPECVQMSLITGSTELAGLTITAAIFAAAFGAVFAASTVDVAAIRFTANRATGSAATDASVT
jgi:hypothetical protein